MADYHTQTNKTIQKSFEEFHAKNPHVYVMFKEQVEKAVLHGKTKISSKTLLGYIRWEMNFTVKSNTAFKINDAYTSRYVRLLVKEIPKYKSLFEFRELRSA